jgi:hypothetical protein
MLETKLEGLVVLDHPSVASGLAIVREQAAYLVQCLLVVASRLSSWVVFEAHEESPPLSGTGLQELYAPAAGISSATVTTLACVDRPTLGPIHGHC